MRKTLIIISFAILAGMTASSILCAAKVLTADANRLSLLAGTALWFALAPFWVKRER